MSNPESQQQEPTLVPLDQEDQLDVLELLSRAENIIAGITPFDEKRPL